MDQCQLGDLFWLSSEKGPKNLIFGGIALLSQDSARLRLILCCEDTITVFNVRIFLLLTLELLRMEQGKSHVHRSFPWDLSHAMEECA